MKVNKLRIKNFRKNFSILMSLLLVFSSYAPFLPYAFAQNQATTSATQNVINSLPSPSIPTSQNASPNSNLIPNSGGVANIFNYNQKDSASILGRIMVAPLLRRNFQYKDKISVNVYNVLSGNFRVKVLNAKGEDARVSLSEQDLTDKIQININPSTTFVPGKYTVQILQGSQVVSSQDFTWGVLAINTDKSTYSVGETADIAMTVLDETGDLVCNADVVLIITDPSGQQSILSTSNRKIKVNSVCGKKIFTLTPDYQSSYQVGDEGQYSLSLSATTKNGQYSVTDTFQVDNSESFSVKRIAPTRLYPPLIYPVSIQITANKDFTGKVTEVVPSNFNVFDASGSAKSPDSIKTIETSKINADRPLGIKDLAMPFSGSPAASLGFGEDLSMIDPAEQGFYQQYGLSGHDGLDLSMPIGSPVYSVDAGTVVMADENGPYGWTVVVQHEWGRTYYGHVSQFIVQLGQKVSKGEEIALSGATGHVTGPHLHFGVRLNKYDINNGYFGKTDPALLLGLPTDGRVLGESIEDQQTQTSKVLSWNIDVKKGETILLGYSFKSPQQSPQFYTLGPARFFDQTQANIFQEARSWQLAVDTGSYTGRQLKTVEYILGGGTDTNSEATGNFVYAGSSWNTTKGSAGTTTVYLAGSNISVRNAYVEAQSIRQTATNLSDVDMSFDANPGPNAGNDTRVSPVINNANVYQGSTGPSQRIMVRADVTASFTTQSDSDWSTGVAVVAGFGIAGPSFAATTMKLVITFETDYSDSSHTEIKTVKFPLDSTAGTDTGSTQSACGASSTCSFAYNAQISDLLSGSNSNMKSVFFEIKGISDSTTAPSITPQINGGTAGTSVSEQEVLGDVRDMNILYSPIIGGSDFVPNSASQLDVVNGSVALNALGGDLVITYLYDTGASTQTQTVSYWAEQETAKPAAAKTAFPTASMPRTISNAGLSVKNIWYEVNTAYVGAGTLTIYGNVGSAGEKNKVYTLTGTNARAGDADIIYDMSADASSFSSATTNVAGAAKFSVNTMDQEVAAQLFITFTWSGSSGGTQTKTVQYFGGTSGTSSVVANEPHNFAVNIFTPETVTKTWRSSYINSYFMHSRNATTIRNTTEGDYVNGNLIFSITEDTDTEAYSRTLLASISATMFTADSSPNANTIGFLRRAFGISNILGQADILTASNVFVVTYDAAFDENGVSENSKTVKTIEYVLGGGTKVNGDVTLAQVYAGTSWNTNRSTAGYLTATIPGTGIQVRNAYLDYRFTASASATFTDLDMFFDASPGPNAGTDGRASPIIQGNYFVTSGQSYWLESRADVTSQLSTQSDSDWNNGVGVKGGVIVTGPGRSLETMRLVITYEEDYGVSSSEIKTVKFPLSSTASGDTGSKRASCAASTTCSFSYNAQIPDLLGSSNSNIENAYFEIRGTTDASTTMTMTPQIHSGTAGTSVTEVTATAGMRDFYIIFQPIVGGSDFSPNAAGQLDIVNGSKAIGVLGGDLVVTYIYDTTASNQTETVKFFAQQQSTPTGTTKTAFTNTSFSIQNTGLSVKNLWFEVHSSQTAANTLTVFGQVGGASEKSIAYSLTGTGVRAGESVIVHDMSADATSFNAATTTVTGNSQWSSATGDSEVGAVLYVTFTWSGNQGGTQTKTVEFNGKTSPAAANQSNEFINLPPTIFLPESVTKTYESVFLRSAVGHSNATTISNGTLTFSVNGIQEQQSTEDTDTEAFSGTYFVPIGSTDFSGGSTIGFSRRTYELTQSISVANSMGVSNGFMVTYDAAFASNNAETPTLAQLMRHGQWFNSSGASQPFTF